MNVPRERHSWAGFKIKEVRGRVLIQRQCDQGRGTGIGAGDVTCFGAGESGAGVEQRGDG